MRSEFEKLLKQHRDALTDELVKLGKHRQVQLAEWDIERNETDYEFYFDGAWNAQQAKIDKLQEKLDASEKTRSTLYEENVDLRAKNDDLQKRVDKAIRLLVEAELYQSEPNIDLAVQALRGNN